MKELVEQIDAHSELDEMESINIPRARDQPGGDLLSPVANSSRTKQPTRPDPPFHQPDC